MFHHGILILLSTLLFDSHRVAGKGLIDLFSCDQVQSFVYGTPAQSLHADKAIFQAGALRKVCICSITTIMLCLHCIGLGVLIL